MPHINRIFRNSIFPCAAFNFGKVCTKKHRDVLNCPFGFCAITALGEFDPTQGGHLVIWPLKLVIEFPHASTILVPSATFAHSNVAVPAEQSRISFTQYAPGGLFRYVDNNFMTERQLEAADLAAYVQMEAKKGSRWAEGLGLLSTLDELLRPLTS